MIKKDLHRAIVSVLLIALISLIFGHLHAQQRVDYRIEASLDAKKKWIVGDIEMGYHNNSMDTLTEIWIHLWPNAYSSHQSAFARQMLDMGYLQFHYTDRYGRIDSLLFTIDGKPATVVTAAESPDMVMLLPDQPIMPGQQVLIASPFRTKLPPIVSRSGYEKNFIAATQWYPKPAVYDRNGWHPMPYLEQGEFYSEFGRFEVNLTLPHTWVLAATGHVIDTITPLDTLSPTHTYRIVQNNVHDFAWFASKGYFVQQDTMVLPSGKVVTVQAMMKNNPKLAEKAIDYTAQTIRYMSEHVGEYPYNVCTVVMGPAGMGSGMEYPTIFTVEEVQLLEVTVHEAVHNWWYGILANNERRYPWLDESITSYYEHRIVNSIQSSEKYRSELDNVSEMGIAKAFGFDRLPKRPLEKNIVLYQQRINKHQAINSSSEAFTPLNYYAMIYVKGALAMDYLEAYLGRERFDEAMRAFYTKKSLQHISPEDLRFYFESVTGEDLGWFFEGVIGSNEQADIKLKKAEREGDSLKVTLYNSSSYPLPVPLVYQSKDLKSHAAYWVPPFQGETIYTIPASDSSWQIVADGDWLTFDINRSNNYYKLQQGLPRFEPVRLQFLAAPEDPSRDQLFFSPVLGGNAYDGFQLGLAFYNRVLPAKKFDFEVVPMFGFRSKDFNWIANFSYHIQPKKQKPIDIEIGLHSKSFNMNIQNYRDGVDFSNRFYKVEPRINIVFDKSKGHRGPIHSLSIRHIRIWEEKFNVDKIIVLDGDSTFTYRKDLLKFCANEISYSFKKDHSLYPFSAGTKVLFNRDFVRQSFEVTQGIRYTQKGAFIKMRLFAGAFYYRNKDVSFRNPRNFILGFNMSGISGDNDFLYDHHFLGRNQQDGFLSQQIAMGEGNFKVITLTQKSSQEGRTVNWLMAANFKVDFPISKVPVKFFADLGYSVDKVIAPENFLPIKQFHYDLGLCFSLFGEGLEIYFPLAMSENFRNYYKANLPKFGQRITFMMDMNKLNLHRQIRDVPFSKVFSMF